MNELEAVLVEVHRLQMLAFIGRSARGGPCVSAWDIAQWLRLPVTESSLLVAELTDEGFVDGNSFANPYQASLRLTPLGLGVLEWNRQQGARRYRDSAPRQPPPAAAG